MPLAYTWELHFGDMRGIVLRAEHEEVEAIILLMDQAAVEVFRTGEGVLENPRMHDSASSVTGHPHHAMKAYAIEEDTVFDMPLTGAFGRLCGCEVTPVRHQKVLTAKTFKGRPE